MPTQPDRRKRSVVEVDGRGRVSLARYGLKDTQLVVEEIEDGGLVLYPAVVLTPAELRHLGDPTAIAALDKALETVSDTRKMQLKSASD
jgi:hypothetical protein